MKRNNERSKKIESKLEPTNAKATNSRLKHPPVLMRQGQDEKISGKQTPQFVSVANSPQKDSKKSQSPKRQQNSKVATKKPPITHKSTTNQPPQHPPLPQNKKSPSLPIQTQGSQPSSPSQHTKQHNNYLSITSLPDNYREYRPSGESIRKHYLSKEEWNFNNRYDEYKAGFETGNSGNCCTQCHFQGEMDTDYKIGWVAWSWVVFLGLATGVLFFLPLVMKSFQEKQSICPDCGSIVKVDKPTCL